MLKRDSVIKCLSFKGNSVAVPSILGAMGALFGLAGVRRKREF
ncbi:PEP-CTERM sorting domain-containing protein [Pediococcus ethanolidurans]|nr:PEP-CTERM sorting domain-containing protein [Pediococcus ethanolidurans]MBU7554338.1 PEP-CTERM sorting domain-containing protein [Pediococcus ethanolidurans]MBU7564493.1 PEP-CTERM sorting domain-containing protein [Pediococcus ethanolidurans]MCV3315552.1 PEP-CTERM sorting domain-containing protein [Pediococcus ethanolidurans]MCV3321108.1 PEP-CTERM sorting domain-containing protein [Pediococcus ethanolidurans]MCV3323811.1 PEP-CTERM sorting domain-containing protein [Pediococcus ethanoliduran